MKTIDALTIKLERINALAEVLYELVHGNQRAQILTEIIMETSAPPKSKPAV